METNSKIKELIKQIQSELENLTSEQRVNLFDDIEYNYCRFCGDYTGGFVCYCENEK